MLNVLIKKSESGWSLSAGQRVITLRTIYGKLLFDREIISGRQRIHTTVDKRNGHGDKWTWHRARAHANVLSLPPTALLLYGELLIYVGEDVANQLEILHQYTTRSKKVNIFASQIASTYIKYVTSKCVFLL